MARLQSRIPQTFDVEMYGAKADGVTNDAPFIQAAIDKAYSLGGGRVILRRGIHRITTPIQMKIRVELVGQGTKKTFIKPDAGVDGIRFVKLAGDSVDCHTVVSDMSIEGAGIAAAGTQRGIAFTTDAYYAHVNFYRIRIIGFNGDGFQSSTALFPNQSVFVGQFDEVRVQQCSGHGFCFEVGTTLTFANCYASANKKAGFRIKSNAYGSIQDTASEENGIAFEMIGNQCFNIYSSGCELTTDYSAAYPGIVLSDLDCQSCSYIGMYMQRFDNAGGNNNQRRYMKFDGSKQCKVAGLRLKSDPLGVKIPNFSYEIINGAVVYLDGVTIDSLPAGLAKIGNGEFRNYIASDLHNSTSASHFFRVDQEIEYNAITANMTLTVNSPGVQHINGGAATRVIVLPLPTFVSPNLHGMTFHIKNVGGTNNLEIREGTVTGTLRGTLLPNEWATYRWDVNFPRYFEWK